MRVSRLVMAGIAAMVVMTSGVYAVDKADGWIDDFENARKEAVKREVPVLAFFTGSDWCGWCKKLDAEVLSKEEFKKFAKENFVLLVLDFPSRTKLPEATVKQNKKLQGAYNIKGFPTLVILDAEGKELARTGYRRGGAEAYVEHLKTLLK